MDDLYGNALVASFRVLWRLEEELGLAHGDARSTPRPISFRRGWSARATSAPPPSIGRSLFAVCPDCGAEQQVTVDPYLCLAQAGSDLFAEIHALAMVYHWDEPAILALPVDRRRLYLKLIDRARGMVA